MWNGQVKINKDILTYSERGIGGLSLKQTIFGGAAILAAIVVYYFGNKFFGEQVALILCAVIAVPLAAVGFVTYNGMTFVQLVKAMFNSKCIPVVLLFKSKSYYKEMISLSKYIDKSSPKEDKHNNAAKNSPSSQAARKEG